MTTEEKEAARNAADSYWWWVQQLLYCDQMVDDAGNRLDLKRDVLGRLYGIDYELTRLHQTMCELLGLTEEQTRPVTDHMDECEDFEDFWQRLLTINQNKEKTNALSEDGQKTDQRK